VGWKGWPGPGGVCTQRQHLYFGWASIVATTAAAAWAFDLGVVAAADSDLTPGLAGWSVHAGSLLMNCWALLMARLISSSVLMSLKWQVCCWLAAAVVAGSEVVAGGAEREPVPQWWTRAACCLVCGSSKA